MAPLTEDEWYVLNMCRTFTEHLIGKKLFEEATQALVKSRSLLKDSGSITGGHFACFRPGTIDYTPYHEIIRTLIEAMESKNICKITYKAIMEDRSKIYYICPLKLFSHVDTIYLHAKKARTPGEKYSSPKFDPILPVHRFMAVELTERKFELPQNYDFDKAFNRTFGVMKDDTFAVEVEFTGWAARYVSERIWSQDQEIKKISDNKIRLFFTATSDQEVLSWILSFKDEAKLIQPEYLINEIENTAMKLKKMYS
jgi:predicted DNA-binding transcriptional regulator YafY